MRWHVRRIAALRPRTFPPDFPAASASQPYRLIGVRRNEIQVAVSTENAKKWTANTAPFRPCLVDKMADRKPGGDREGIRTQRTTYLLHHVAYRIDASPALTAKANQPREKAEDDEDRGPDSVTKYAEMFKRRVRKGQCFHRPYLGCREFAAMFAEPSEKDDVLTGWTESLGLVLYDIRFGAKGNRPGFFDAKVTDGVLHCDAEGKGGVRVYGWDAEGGAE